MNRFLTLLLAASCLTAVGQVTYPYNPDGNADGDIAVGDLQDFLVNYGNPFSPSEILVGDTALSDWLYFLDSFVTSLQETIQQQQAQIDSMSSVGQSGLYDITVSCTDYGLSWNCAATSYPPTTSLLPDNVGNYSIGSSCSCEPSSSLYEPMWRKFEIEGLPPGESFFLHCHAFMRYNFYPQTEYWASETIELLEEASGNYVFYLHGSYTHYTLTCVSQNGLPQESGLEAYSINVWNNGLSRDDMQFNILKNGRQVAPTFYFGAN